MKTFDVETTVTYKQWIRVAAEDEYAAQKRVNDMAWDVTAIQYQTMERLKRRELSESALSEAHIFR